MVFAGSLGHAGAAAFVTEGFEGAESGCAPGAGDHFFDMVLVDITGGRERIEVLIEEFVDSFPGVVGADD